jgi:hypothetical protein
LIRMSQELIEWSGMVIRSEWIGQGDKWEEQKVERDDRMS